MHWRLSAFLAWRYLSKRRAHGVAGVFSLISSIGIALGVAILITVLSVMNGFEQQIHRYFFAEQPHITVESWENTWELTKSVEQNLSSTEGVKSWSPQLQGQGLLMAHHSTQGVLLTGVIPGQDHASNSQISHLSVEQMSTWSGQAFGCVLMRELASHLQVKVGDSVLVVVPRMRTVGMSLMPTYHKLKVIAVLDGHERDMIANQTVWLHLSDLQKLLGLRDQITSVRVTIDRIADTLPVKQRLVNLLGESYWIRDWSQQFHTFFQAIKTEKSMMFVILFFIILIALLNLLSSLIMLLLIKKRDVGYLRTLGYTAADCQLLFLCYGLWIGLIACGLGVGVGLVLTHYVNGVLHLVEAVVGHSLVPASVYFVDHLPTEVRIADVLAVVGLTLLACVLSNLVPARMAAKLDPAKLMRAGHV